MRKVRWKGSKSRKRTSLLKLLRLGVSEVKIMTQLEKRVLDYIRERGGRISVDLIARKLNISIDYARNLCESLGKADQIDFFYSKICILPEKKKGTSSKKGEAPQEKPVSLRWFEHKPRTLSY